LYQNVKDFRCAGGHRALKLTFVPSLNSPADDN